MASTKMFNHYDGKKENGVKFSCCTGIRVKMQIHVHVSNLFIDELHLRRLEYVNIGVRPKQKEKKQQQ